MSGYRLVQISKSVYQITQGKTKVGFVNVCPTGYVGRIGSHCEVRGTAKAAFEAVASKALGFNSVSEVHAHNAQARATNRALRGQAQYLVQEMKQGNFEPLIQVLEGIK